MTKNIKIKIYFVMLFASALIVVGCSNTEIKDQKYQDNKDSLSEPVNNKSIHQRDKENKQLDLIKVQPERIKF